MTRPRESNSSEIRVSASHSRGRAVWPARSTTRSKACDCALPAQLAPTLIPSTRSAQWVFRLFARTALPEGSHSRLIWWTETLRRSVLEPPRFWLLLLWRFPRGKEETLSLRPGVSAKPQADFPGRQPRFPG